MAWLLDDSGLPLSRSPNAHGIQVHDVQAEFIRSDPRPLGLHAITATAMHAAISLQYSISKNYFREQTTCIEELLTRYAITSCLLI